MPDYKAGDRVEVLISGTWCHGSIACHGSIVDCDEGDLEVDYESAHGGRESRWFHRSCVRAVSGNAVGRAPLPSTEVSDDNLCYDVSKWQRYLWDEHTEIAEDKVESVNKLGVQRADRFPDFMRETFARLYQPDLKPLDQPDAPWAEKLHNVADEMPAFRQLQEQCHGDEISSGMGATAICESLAREMKPRESNVDIDELRRRVETFEEMQQLGAPVEERIKETKQAIEAAEQEAKVLADGLDPTALRQAMRGACEQASQDISDTNDACAAFGYGDQPGAPVRMETAQRRALAGKLKSARRLKEIAKLAGRLRRIAANKQQNKVVHGADEISDVVCGNDLARLLPVELVQLAGDDPDLEALAFSRYSDAQLLQYEMKGTEEQGRGPIVVCIDESGSMSGEADSWAKAVALALLEVATRQKRSFAVVHFDTAVSRVDAWEKGEAFSMDYRNGQRTDAGLKPVITSKANLTEMLIEMAEHFTGGGTSFEAPLEAATRIIEQEAQFKKADIVFITDGNAPFADDKRARFLAAKTEHEFSLFTVLVKQTRASSIEDVSDRVFKFSDIVASDDGFNDEVFSI